MSVSHTVSLIIPVHSPHPPFPECFRSVIALQPPPDEIIVVVDAPQIDSAFDFLSQFKINLLCTQGWVGPAAARNLGAKHATGDLLLFFDSDVKLPPDIISRFLMVFHTQPEVAAVIGSYDDQPADPGFISQFKNLFHHYVHQTASPTASTFWGACGAIRRPAFESVNGFDESFSKPSIEDIDLGYRLLQQGYSLRLCRDIQVKHMKKWTLASMIRTDFFQRALPWTRLILRYRRIHNDLNLKLSSRFSVALVFLFFLSLLLSAWTFVFLFSSLLILLLMLLLNFPLLRFFAVKRGLLFAFAAFPLLWVYYGYSGLAFLLENLRFFLSGESRNLMLPQAVSRKPEGR